MRATLGVGRARPAGAAHPSGSGSVTLCSPSTAISIAALRLGGLRTERAGQRGEREREGESERERESARERE